VAVGSPFPLNNESVFRRLCVYRRNPSKKVAKYYLGIFSVFRLRRGAALSSPGCPDTGVPDERRKPAGGAGLRDCYGCRLHEFGKSGILADNGELLVLVDVVDVGIAVFHRPA